MTPLQRRSISYFCRMQHPNAWNRIHKDYFAGCPMSNGASQLTHWLLSPNIFGIQDDVRALSPNILGLTGYPTVLSSVFQRRVARDPRVEWYISGIQYERLRVRIPLGYFFFFFFVRWFNSNCRLFRILRNLDELTCRIASCSPF